MGKNLIQQRRGKGNTRYRSSKHIFIGKPMYSSSMGSEGIVEDIMHSRGRKLPFAIVDFGGKREMLIPSEGMSVGQKITVNGSAEAGNILELGKVPEGTKIFNIELRPLDGGKLCRNPGSFGLLTIRTEKNVVVVLPSKKQKTLSLQCRATIGVPAGGGRQEKPMLKAGKRYFAMKSTGKLYPNVSKTAMNSVDHPFGGSNFGKAKTRSHDSSPGAKVGSISPRRTGKRKR
ncbi:MAG: 50S ribosomal protein L2 [Candidatus Aenigmatarchaeota archaeon]